MDFDEKDALETKEELESLKHKLFMENVRLQSERGQIEAEYENIANERKDIQRERRQLQHEKKLLNIEMGQLRDEVNYERARLQEEERFLDRKQRLIERSFELLDKDKEELKASYKRLEREKIESKRINASLRGEVLYETGMFFRGIKSASGLKKRYKELLKIYHPDNESGDNEILININKEYEELRKKFEKK